MPVHSAGGVVFVPPPFRRPFSARVLRVRVLRVILRGFVYVGARPGKGECACEDTRAIYSRRSSVLSKPTGGIFLAPREPGLGLKVPSRLGFVLIRRTLC